MELKWYQVTGQNGSPIGGAMLMEDDRATAYIAMLTRVEPTLAVCEIGTPPGTTLLSKVRGYALGHYDCGGWDVIVECWSDAELAEAITPAETIEQALYNTPLAACVDVWADRQADAAVEGCTGDQFCSYHKHV